MSTGEAVPGGSRWPLVRLHRPVLLLSWLLIHGLLSACGGSGPVPVMQLQPQDFVKAITVEGALKTAQSTPVRVSKDVVVRVRLAWLEDDGTPVQEGQVLARFDAEEMTQRLRQGEGDLASARMELQKNELDGGLRVAGADTVYEVSGLKLDFAEQFRLLDDEVFSRKEIAENRIDGELAAYRQQHADSARRTERERTSTQEALIAIKERQAQESVDEARSGLGSLEVLAPHDGIFLVKRDWSGEPLKVGAQLWRDGEIGEIPDLETIEAQVYVLEADAGGLEVGKAATVWVEAFPDQPLEGTVKHVDKVAQPRFRGSPVQYFGVTIELAEAPAAVLKPGHRVRATLHLEQQAGAMVLPRQSVFQEEGQNVVYRRQGTLFERRAVTVGPSSMGLAVITEGLQAGDEVALSRPPSSLLQEAASPADGSDAGGETGGAEEPSQASEATEPSEPSSKPGAAT